MVDKKVIPVITIGIIIVICTMKYEEFTSDIELVNSTVNNKKYLVRNKPDKQKAANILANISEKLQTLVDHLIQKYSDDQRVKLLYSRFNPDNISETAYNNKYTSYSVNKGEKIVFCLRSRDTNEVLENENTLMFVALHEFSHIMTTSIGHTKEFWDNFAFVLKEAIQIKVYQYQNFKDRPVKYCGTMITDTPLDN